MSKLKIMLPIVVLSLGISAAYALIATRPVLKPEPVSHTIPTVTVMTAQPETVTLNVMSQGIVKPRHELDLTAEVSGKVLYLHPQFVTGGFFNKDEVLLQLDSRDYEAAIVQAQAQIAEAKRLLATEQAQAEQARTEWQALGSGKASALVMREPQLQEARAKLKAAESALMQAKIQHARCLVRAPFAGRFADKTIALGQLVQVSDKLARIYSTDVAEARLPVSLNQLAYLAISLNEQPKKPIPVTLTASVAGQVQTWQGQIVRSEGMVDESTGVIHLIAEVKQPYQYKQPLLTGLFVQADIQGKVLDNIFALPQQAINANQEVLIVDNNQQLHTRRLEVLRHEGQRVLIQQGLTAGERIITSGIDIPIEGMTVQVDK